MNDQLVEIKLHGVLAEQVGREVWNLAVSSVGEAVRALESQSKKLYKNLIKNDKKNIKYRILINEKDFLYDKEKDINTQEGINSSELVREYQDLRSIDIVPIVEGADAKDVFAIIAGIILIVLGVFTFGATTQMGMMLIAGGLGLMAAGIANLLTPMPEFGDFREIEGGGRAAYIFSGPENTVREGGPVFIGYGRLLVGSQVIQSSIQTFDVRNDNVMNTNDLVRNIGRGDHKGQHWGLENYGLDYRDSGSVGGLVPFDRAKDDVFANNLSKKRKSSTSLMLGRVIEWNKLIGTTKTADNCPVGIGGVMKSETILRRDGDEFTTSPPKGVVHDIDSTDPTVERYTSKPRTKAQNQKDQLENALFGELEIFFEECNPKKDADGNITGYENQTCYDKKIAQLQAHHDKDLKHPNP